MQWIIQQNKKDENKSKAAAVKVNKINLKKQGGRMSDKNYGICC